MNKYFTVNSHGKQPPYHYIDKLNIDMWSDVFFVQRGFWISTFSRDASGKLSFSSARHQLVALSITKRKTELYSNKNERVTGKL